MQTTVAEAVKFVVDRMEEEDKKDSRPLRGPYMACLELIHRLRQRGCPDEEELGTHTQTHTSAAVIFGTRFNYLKCICFSRDQIELCNVVGICSFQKANILHSLAQKMW